MDAIQQTYIDQSSASGRADLNKSDFDKLVMEKGRSVIHEKALLCPCKGKASAHQSNCMNCGGSGWAFINAVPTRMILSGVEVSTKLVPWSEEVRGMVSVTAMCEEELSFMDKITTTDAVSIYNQVVYFKKTGTTLFAYLAYKPIEVQYVGLFQAIDQTYKRLTEGVDFTVEGQALILDNAYAGVGDDDYSVTVRYKHAPAFHLVELKRETMQSFRLEGRVEKQQSFPVHGYARRAHYVLNQENLTNTRLLNNSYEIVIDVADGVADVTAPVFPFDLVQGDTFERIVKVVEDDVAVDVTTRTYRMMVKKDDGTLVLDFTEGNGIAKTAPNLLTLSQTSIVTAAIDPGVYSYDLQETNGSVIETILRGTFIVSKQVTIP